MTSPLKIAMPILHADPARGGAERYTVDVAAGLRDLGHDVSILATTFCQPVPGVAFVEIPVTGITRRGRYVSYLAALDAHLGRARYDVVHAMLPVLRCDIYHPHAGIAAEAIAAGHLKYHSPVARASARVFNAINPKRRIFATVERELLERPNGPIVLNLSDYVKAAVRKHYPTVPESRLATLLNGVDLDKFDPQKRPGAGAELRHKLSIPADRVVALILAQDFERKGLREAIEAVAAVVGVTLLVVGKPDPSKYREFALGLNASVIFAGGTTDPYAFYSAADLFILPTRHDPCSLVVLEALAMGLPVISTRFNGACEAMIDGLHGHVLADPADVRALTKAIRKTIDPPTLARMKAACLMVRPRLSVATHLRSLADLYGRACSAKARP